MRARLAGVVAALCLAVSLPVCAQAPIDTSAPVVLRADTLTHDSTRDVVTASGNVELAQGERILFADTVSYDQRNDTVTASGNVTMLEPTGEVVFADYVELRDEMKSGVIRDFRMLLTDGSRLAANGAVRSDGRTEMRKAVYSPCRLCPDHPEHPPLWQLKAVRLVHDQERRDIEYSDAFLEVFGVPVAYTPYFSHPDPTVKRRSGFLTPTFGNRSELGLTSQIPYFFNLAPYRDATFAPIFTSKEGVVLAGEYRERTLKGQFQLAGSITRPEKRDDQGNLVGEREIRGHIEGLGRFDIDDTWRWGFDIERSTDDTYLRRYGFSSEDTLTSHLFVEGFRGRNYAAVNGYAFQGLEIDDDPGDTPIVLPIADYSFISDSGRHGDRYTIDANLMALTRTAGTDSRRLSLTGGWHLPYIGPIGDVYTLSASLRGDVYLVDEVEVPTGTGIRTESGLTGRVVPLLSLDWRYPFIRQSGTVRQVIEPMFRASISPNGGNPDKIPNEDSQNFEFDDTNLFSVNRFPGLDRIEGGPRISYGLRLGAYGLGGGRTTAFIGQSFRVREDSTFEPGSGLEDNLSDFVGRVTIAPSKFLDLAYRFQLDGGDFAPRRNEVDLTAGPDWLRLNVGFLSIEDAPSDLEEIGTREELFLSARLALSRYWALDAHNRSNPTFNDTISNGVGISYQDECFGFSATLTRNFTRDRDVEPTTTFLIRVTLRTLGSFGTSGPIQML
ncbi:MAG: LPS-assembly protein LptD [Proteobacteria bacterium]|nr:LPS-assembly protein LptD [Pseudomonadota bacterium]